MPHDCVLLHGGEVARRRPVVAGRDRTVCYWLFPEANYYLAQVVAGAIQRAQPVQLDMTLKALVRATAGGIAAMCLVAMGCSLFGRQSLVLTPSGPMHCVAVELPSDSWHTDPEVEKQANRVIVMGRWPDQPEFRLSPRQPAEITVSMQVHPGSYLEVGSVFSTDKYTFRMDHPRVWTASEGVWADAKELARGEKRGPVWSDSFYRTDATYQGKSFRRTGQFAYGSDVSEHGRWIAVYSYDGRQTPKSEQYGGSLAWPGKGPDPSKGIFHVDLYDVASGKKVGGFTGPFRGNPDLWRLEASFLADRYYVFGTELMFRNFWFCELPALKTKE